MPGWQAQLEALDLEARHRHGSVFAGLDAARRESLLRSRLGGAGAGLPGLLEAGHVALALLTHWFGSADALDRCYGRHIGLRACRGIATAPREPEALP